MAHPTAKNLVNKTPEELKALLAEQGVDIDYQALAQVHEQAAFTVPMPVPPADRSNNRVYKTIVSVSRILTQAISIAQIAFVQGIVAPLMAVALAYVEWDRVSLGISQFDATHAGMLAFVAMAMYIVLTIIEAGYGVGTESQQKESWTFRRFLGSARQFIVGRPTVVTEVQQIRGIINAVQLLIVISASFGALQGQFDGLEIVSFNDVFTTISADYRVATSVVIQSLLALSLLRGLHWSLFRVYRTTTNLVGDMEVDDKRSFLSEQQAALSERQRVGDEAVKMKLIQLILEQRQQQKSQSAIPELSEPMSYLNGSHTS